MATSYRKHNLYFTINLDRSRTKRLKNRKGQIKNYT